MQQIGSSNHSKIYSNGQYAIKIIQHRHNRHLCQCYHLHQEYQTLDQLNHPHILKVKTLQIKEQKTYNSKNDKYQKIQYCQMISELCDTDIYKLVQSNFPKLLSAQFIKKIFFQISSALLYLHQQKNMCHFDIKPENIFLKKESVQKWGRQLKSLTSSPELQDIEDGYKTSRISRKTDEAISAYQYSSRLGDFGFSSKISDLNVEKCVDIWTERSLLYLSPEIIIFSQNLNNITEETVKMMNWKAIDVFSFGVALFNMIFLVSPYEGQHASSNDPMYKHIALKKYDQFWTHNPQVVYLLQNLKNPELLMDLIQNTISFDPNDRYTIQQVYSHKYFQV